MQDFLSDPDISPLTKTLLQEHVLPIAEGWKQRRAAARIYSRMRVKGLSLCEAEHKAWRSIIGLMRGMTHVDTYPEIKQYMQDQGFKPVQHNGYDTNLWHKAYSVDGEYHSLNVGFNREAIQFTHLVIKDGKQEIRKRFALEVSGGETDTVWKFFREYIEAPAATVDISIPVTASISSAISSVANAGIRAIASLMIRFLQKHPRISEPIAKQALRSYVTRKLAKIPLERIASLPPANLDVYRAIFKDKLLLNAAKLLIHVVQKTGLSLDAVLDKVSDVMYHSSPRGYKWETIKGHTYLVSIGDTAERKTILSYLGKMKIKPVALGKSRVTWETDNEYVFVDFRGKGGEVYTTDGGPVGEKLLFTFSSADDFIDLLNENPSLYE